MPSYILYNTVLLSAILGLQHCLSELRYRLPLHCVVPLPLNRVNIILQKEMEQVLSLYEQIIPLEAPVAFAGQALPQTVPALKTNLTANIQ